MMTSLGSPSPYYAQQQRYGGGYSYGQTANAANSTAINAPQDNRSLAQSYQQTKQTYAPQDNRNLAVSNADNRVYAPTYNSDNRNLAQSYAYDNRQYADNRNLAQSYAYDNRQYADNRNLAQSYAYDNRQYADNRAYTDARQYDNRNLAQSYAYDNRQYSNQEDNRRYSADNRQLTQTQNNEYNQHNRSIYNNQRYSFTPTTYNLQVPPAPTQPPPPTPIYIPQPHPPAPAPCPPNQDSGFNPLLMMLPLIFTLFKQPEQPHRPERPKRPEHPPSKPPEETPPGKPPEETPPSKPPKETPKTKTVSIASTAGGDIKVAANTSEDQAKNPAKDYNGSNWKSFGTAFDEPGSYKIADDRSGSSSLNFNIKTEYARNYKKGEKKGTIISSASMTIGGKKLTFDAKNGPTLDGKKLTQGEQTIDGIKLTYDGKKVTVKTEDDTYVIETSKIKLANGENKDSLAIGVIDNFEADEKTGKATDKALADEGGAFLDYSKKGGDLVDFLRKNKV